MRNLLVALCLIGSLAAAETTTAETRVAKVDINSLREELREVILAKPENDALKKADEQYHQREDKRNQVMQHDSGQEHKAIQDVLKDLPHPDEKVREKIERLIRAEILRYLVKKYGNRFTIVLDSDQATDALVYLDGEIVDVTQAIRQSIQLNTF